MPLSFSLSARAKPAGKGCDLPRLSPLHTSSLFGPEKPVPRPVPAQQTLRSDGDWSKAPLAAGPEEFFDLLQVKKIPAQPFDQFTAWSTIHAGRGEALTLKNLSAIGRFRFRRGA